MLASSATHIVIVLTFVLMCYIFYAYGVHRDLHVLTHSFPTRRSSDLPETNYMLGFALLAKGDTKQAMGFFRRAHVMSPDTVRYKIGFARALRDLSLKRPDPELIGTVLRLLGTPGVEPRDLASVVESGIRLDPTFALLNGLDPLSPDAAGAILANPKRSEE